MDDSSGARPSPNSLGAVGSLSIVVPMWNEEESFSPCVVAMLAELSDLEDASLITSGQLVIVDDASTDSTPTLCDSLASHDQRVRIVHHKTNTGLGGAVRSGLSAATGDRVLYTDADLPFDLKETERLIRLAQVYEAGVVSAYRFERRAEGFRRMIYSSIYNGLVRVMLGIRVRDVNFACKLINQQVLKSIDIKSEGSFIDAEILAKAERRGFKIIQVGLDFFPRTVGLSTLSSLKTIRRMLGEIFSQFRAIRRLKPDSSAK
jgi:glycosyltransferase involved in cell wall biosynthesis